MFIGKFRGILGIFRSRGEKSTEKERPLSLGPWKRGLEKKIDLPEQYDSLLLKKSTVYCRRTSPLDQRLPNYGVHSFPRWRTVSSLLDPLFVAESLLLLRGSGLLSSEPVDSLSG